MKDQGENAETGVVFHLFGDRGAAGEHAAKDGGP